MVVVGIILNLGSPGHDNLSTVSFLLGDAVDPFFILFSSLKRGMNQPQKGRCALKEEEPLFSGFHVVMVNAGWLWI